MLRLLTLALLAAAVAGCDFAPTLDIDTPDYEAGLVLRSVLVADSVALVRVGESWNPYEGRSFNEQLPGDVVIDADVALFRDGQLVERLTARRDTCADLDQPPVPPGGEVLVLPCGPYIGTVPIEEGATYTLRAEAPGYERVEGTVTVPRRPTVEVTEEPVPDDQSRRFRIRLGDTPGVTDRYGLTLFSYQETARGLICENGVCRDTTYVLNNPGFFRYAFDTSDPVILAASREVAGSGISFASFTDETFDGQTKSFTITPSNRYARASTDGRLVVQLAALSGDVYDLYQIAYFGGGGDNPFAEPITLPSNVTGGYGLVGAVALAEVAFEPRTPAEPSASGARARTGRPVRR